MANTEVFTERISVHFLFGEDLKPENHGIFIKMDQEGRKPPSPLLRDSLGIHDAPISSIPKLTFRNVPNWNENS